MIQMDLRKCWRLDENFQVYRIPLRIINPQTRVSLVITCLFDLGFSGYLGLDSESIAALNLPKIGSGKALTISGLVDYDNYQSFAEIVDENQASIGQVQNLEAETDPATEPILIQAFNMPILGLKAINQFSWLILGQQKMLCMLEQEL